MPHTDGEAEITWPEWRNLKQRNEPKKASDSFAQVEKKQKQPVNHFPTENSLLMTSLWSKFLNRTMTNNYA